MLLYKIIATLIKSLARIFYYAVPVSYEAVSDVIRDHYEDKRLGIETNSLPRMFSKDLSSGAGTLKDGNRYEHICYRRLDLLIPQLGPTDNEVFVDFGCGKGRVIFYLGTKLKMKKLVGVEYEANVAAIAKKNLSRIKVPHSPIEFIQGDAADFDTSEMTILYMYNPFGNATMERVLANIKKGWLANPRRIKIIYYNPLCRDLLSAQDWLKFEGLCPVTGAGMWKTV